MNLFDALSKISDDIDMQRHLMTSEAATKMVSVRPFIRALGYDTTNLEEVEPEYGADANISGHEKVDYAIKRAGKPNHLD